MMGPFGRSAVDRRRAVTNEEAMLWLKGAVENLAAAMHAENWHSSEASIRRWKRWAVDILLNGERIGCMGLISAALQSPVAHDNADAAG